MSLSEKTGPLPANAPDALFDAVLTPHRSLGPKGFLIVMVGVSAISFAAGIAFLLKGAWPVFGFFGLDVLLVYLAFRANYRSARLYETVRLTEDAVEVRRVSPSASRTGGSSPIGCGSRWTIRPPMTANWS